MKKIKLPEFNYIYLLGISIFSYGIGVSSQASYGIVWLGILIAIYPLYNLIAKDILR